MSAARDKAKAILAQIPNRDITSSGDKDLFTRFTNTSHATMKANWDGGGIMTACNGFTGWYSATMGRAGLGVFDLPGVGGSAFVLSDGVALPQLGDVFRMKKLHVGVCLDCNGAEWTVLEAGQGGKSTGFDILRRSKRQFNPKDVLGWVNIDIWLDPEEQKKDALRKSLKGAWNVELNGSKRAYTFTAKDVSYVEKGKKVVGTWEADDQNVILKWPNGVTEHWPLPVPPLYKPAEGTWRDQSGGSGVTKYRHAW
ncbi:MAG: hypothetical protein JNL98_26310 [Bryobacterales bacterium]|nr:hypothetical protein [Bryobacterales bacterium]